MLPIIWGVAEIKYIGFRLFIIIIIVLEEIRKNNMNHLDYLFDVV